MPKTNFITADTQKDHEGIHLVLPKVTENDLPKVSVLTITYQRKHFFQLMYNNWRNYQYPRHKLEWVIIDDSPGTDHDLTDIIPHQPEIKYIKIDKHMSVGEKRNYGVEQCSHDIIVHQDDDDFYFSDSILAKVRILKQYPKCKAVFSNNLAAYNIMNNISFMMDPQIPESCLSLPEASLMYHKSFWQEQKFPTDHFGEGKGFAIGRQKKFVSIPCIFNMVSFTHSRNMTGLARNIETKSINNTTKLSNYFDLFDGITKNIIRKLARLTNKELAPTNYDRVFYINFPGLETECTGDLCTTKELGRIECDMFSHNSKWTQLADNNIDNIDPPLENNDLLLLCWYSTDILNITTSKDSGPQQYKNSTPLPKKLKTLLKHPRSKLLIYNSWECRDFIDPYIKGEFCKYCLNHLQVPLDKIIIATTDFVNPLVHSLSPQVIGYDFPYLYAKSTVNKIKQVSQDPQTKTKTLITLNRRGNDERFAASLFLYTNFQDKIHMSYLTKDKYKESDIKHFGVSTQKYKEFITQLPLILEPENTLDIDEPATKIYNKTITKVNWERQDEIYDMLNESFIMLSMETNAEGYESHVQQVSEKTYKAIKLGMPFIIFTSKPGILQHLKKLGFKTFSPYICEDYDLEQIKQNKEDTSSLKENYYLRFRKLLRELNRLCKLSQDELIQLWNNCLPIVNHNLEVLRSLDNIPTIPIIEK